MKDGISINREQNITRWDRFVLSSPQACPFMTGAWQQALKKSLQIEADIWTADKGDDIVAGVVVYYKSSGNKKVSASPPLTPYTPFAYRQTSGGYPSRATAEHISVSRDLISRISSEYSDLNLLLSPTTDDVRPWIWENWRAYPRYTYMIDLKQELKLSHAIRKQVKKCDRVNFRIDQSWNLDVFWKIYEKTQKRQVFDISMTRNQFFTMAGILHDAGLVQMINAISPDNTTIASRIVTFLPETDTAYDWVAGTNPDYLSSGATPWLMVNAAEKLGQDKFSKWDLCGADFESIARFKSELGGELVHYFQLAAPVAPHRKAWRMLKSIFKKRP